MPCWSLAVRQHLSSLELERSVSVGQGPIETGGSSGQCWLPDFLRGIPLPLCGVVIMEPVLLLVEDSHFDIELLQHAFKKAGLSQPMKVVRDGVDAMSYLLGVGEFADRERYPVPNILLIDLNMPRFSGLEFLTWLRTQPEF